MSLEGKLKDGRAAARGSEIFCRRFFVEILRTREGGETLIRNRSGNKKGGKAVVYGKLNSEGGMS